MKIKIILLSITFIVSIIIWNFKTIRIFLSPHYMDNDAVYFEEKLYTAQ